MQTKICLKCKKEFEKPIKLGLKTWNERTYCSTKCSNADRKRKNNLKKKQSLPNIKLCPVCETAFARPKGKSDKVWKAQICCGKDCSAIYRRKEVTEKRTIARRKQLNPGDRRFERSL